MTGYTHDKNNRLPSLDLTFLYRMGFIAVMFIHAYYTVVFFLYGIPLMVFFNICSVILYISVQWRLNSRKFEIRIIIVLLEIMLHATLATLFLGWDYGFAIQLLCIVPMMFYSSAYKLRISFFLASLATVAFIVLRLQAPAMVCESIDGFASLETIYLINSIICFVSAISFSGLFVYQIISINRQLSQKNNELQRLADMDVLTGLMNRRSMYKQLETAVEERSRLDGIFAVAICDIDDFKYINDRYGHDCGDKVLVQVSALIASMIYPDDAVARWGGEEFLLLMHDSSIESVRRRLEAICSAIADSSYDYNGEKVHVTMTFGVQDSENEMSYDQLIVKADKQLYIGKKSGKNRVVVSRG